MATSFKDRTNEFHSMCERIRTRAHAPTSILERRALLSPEPSNASITKNSKKSPHARSEFSVMAAEISRQITNTAGKLEKLTRRKVLLLLIFVRLYEFNPFILKKLPREKHFLMINLLRSV
jgi:hypothetical protein